MTDRQAQVLDLYRRYRIADQEAFYSVRADVHESARRWAVTLSAVLLVLAAILGALGAADEARRAMWAFLAACTSATATALAAYEAAAGFERLGRQYAETRDAIALADVVGPVAGGLSELETDADRDAEVTAFVARTERLLRSEVDTWSQQAAAMYDAARPPSGREL